MHISGETLLIFTSEKQTLIVQYRSQNCHINVGFEEVNLSTIFLIKVLHSIEYFHFAQQTEDDKQKKVLITSSTCQRHVLANYSKGKMFSLKVALSNRDLMQEIFLSLRTKEIKLEASCFACRINVVNHLADDFVECATIAGMRISRDFSIVNDCRNPISLLKNWTCSLFEVQLLFGGEFTFNAL